jgi:ABC-type polysaccharide/polyol phosphate export permease
MKENFLIFLDFTKKLYRRRYMLKSMALTDLKKRYIGSLFGLVWAVLEPLTLFGIYAVVFGVFLKSKPDPTFGTDNYFLYLLCGLLPWTFFSQSILVSVGNIVANKSLVTKSIGFPSEIFPVITVITNIISHLIAMALLIVGVFLMTGRLPLSTLLIGGYLFLCSVFIVGLGWILSSVYVYLKDLRLVVGLLMNAWFFFTPIFYSPHIVPARLLPLYKLNPMYQVVIGYRYALLAGKMMPLPDLLYLVVISVVSFAIGGIVFRKLKPGFAEVL